MSLTRLSAVLTLCGSIIAINAAGLAAAQAAEGTGTPFGAPPLANAFTPYGAGASAPGALASAQKAGPGSVLILTRPKPEDAAAAVTANPREPNLDALRFYASQNDLARVAAEIRLLRAKVPGWEPPADLFISSKNVELEKPLWDLFAKHDYEALKTAIVDLQQQNPAWQPSGDLTTKLDAAQSYDVLIAASDRKDYAAVIDLATDHGGLLTCGTIDAVWRTAEALAGSGDEARALEAYRFVLTNCSVQHDRLATVQKAMQVLKSPDAIDSLVRMGKRLPNGQNEFADVLLDQVRARVGAAAAGTATSPPNAADLAQLASLAHAPGGSRDAELLGWYSLKQKDFAGAETWFRQAMAVQRSPKAAEGLVLSLRDGGKLAEAIKLAPDFAELGPLNRKLMMEVLVAGLAEATAPPTAEQLAELGGVIEAERSADAAQAFGWSRFKAGDVAAAAGWFKKSLAWQPGENAAIGLMVASRRLNTKGDYDAVVRQYRATFPKVASLDDAMRVNVRAPRAKREPRRGARAVARSDGGWDQGATQIVQTFENGKIDEALAMMDARRANRPEPAGLSVVRGWALFKKGDWDSAKQVFTAVGQKGMTAEADKGLLQIERGYTNPRFR